MVIADQEFVHTISFIVKLRFVHGKQVTAITEIKILQIQILHL